MVNSNLILYIEDNFQNRRLVKRLLTKKGYELIEAEDGLQGIALAAREKPALILMDINLPGIDGMEATSRLKSSPDLAHIPIVAVTAQAMRGDRERIMAAGCDDYLQKPIDNDQLVNTVQRFIGIPAHHEAPKAAQDTPTVSAPEVKEATQNDPTPALPTLEVTQPAQAVATPDATPVLPTPDATSVAQEIPTPTTEKL